MAIPLPTLDRSGLFEGLFQGHQRQDMRQQMANEWQMHLRNAAIREAQEKRLMEDLAMRRDFHPFELEAAREKQRRAPLEYQELEAKIKTEQERAENLKRGGNQRVTAAIQEADALYSRDDPRWEQYLLNKSKQYIPSTQESAADEEFRATPEFQQKIAPHLENAVDMQRLSPGTQNLYRKNMNEELAQIDKAKQVKHAIALAREVTAQNPGMYRKAINIIANPERDPGKIEKLLTAIMPEKDVEAFMTLHKLYADILTKQAQLNGMSRSVYALRLQQQAKPQVKNPDEVNERIFENLENEIGPQIDREKALLYAMKHNLYLPYTKKYSFETGSDNEAPKSVSAPTEMEMKSGIIDGKQVSVRPEDEEDFIKAGGKIQ